MRIPNSIQRCVGECDLPARSSMTQLVDIPREIANSHGWGKHQAMELMKCCVTLRTMGVVFHFFGLIKAMYMAHHDTKHAQNGPITTVSSDIWRSQVLTLICSTPFGHEAQPSFWTMRIAPPRRTSSFVLTMAAERYIEIRINLGKEAAMNCRLISKRFPNR